MGAMVAAGRRAATTCRALLRALHARALKLRKHRYFRVRGSGGEGASAPTKSSAVLAAAFLCATAAAALLFPRAVAFFLPLVASTSAFCATAYLSAAASTDPERGAAKEVVLVRGEGAPAEAGLLEVYADANATAYGGRHGGAVQVGCFLRGSAKRGVDEDGEEVVFAGRLLVPAPDDAAGAGSELEEELAAMQVDRLAEGVWNSYFGRWSAWNHYAVDGCDDDW